MYRHEPAVDCDIQQGQACADSAAAQYSATMVAAVAQGQTQSFAVAEREFRDRMPAPQQGVSIDSPDRIGQQQQYCGDFRPGWQRKHYQQSGDCCVRDHEQGGQPV